MEPAVSDTHTIDVGGRLRQLRLERGQSMRALAKSSGLSTNALSMIERGRTSPSVSTLYKLADALDVPVTAFFRAEPPRQDIVYRKAADRTRMSIPEGIWEGLGGESFTGKIEPFMVTLESGGGSGQFGMKHTGEEFVLCLEGAIAYEVEERQYILSPGDSLIFAANMRHRWRNVGVGKAKLVIAISGFEQGEQPGEFHLTAQKSADRSSGELEGSGALDKEDDHLK